MGLFQQRPEETSDQFALPAEPWRQGAVEQLENLPAIAPELTDFADRLTSLVVPIPGDELTDIIVPTADPAPAADPDADTDQR